MRHLAQLTPKEAARENSREIAWHSTSIESALQKLDATQDGLTADRIAERQQEFGRNILPAHKPPKLWQVALHQFRSPLIYILLAAGVVAIALQDFKDAAFIFAVVLLNAAIGTYQEWKAEQSASALQNLIQVSAHVKRGGVERQIPAQELVPGDIVFLESGYKVPADIRLFQVNALHVDEAFLTGESLAVEKHTAVLAQDTPINERLNIAFAGSTVRSGRGLGVVVATGIETEVGRIAVVTTSAQMSKPPLLQRMEKFAGQVAVIVVGASVLLAAIAIARGIPLIDVFFLAVALAVSAIPEGLPVAITVVLSIATSRMAKRQVIVRKLAAVESLGSCTYIASDKTGTLTVNQQTVKQIQFPSGECFSVTGEGYNGEGEITRASNDSITDELRAQLVRLGTAAILCNEAHLVRQEAEWVQHGDAMDVALLALGYKLELSPKEMRRQFVAAGEIPFESERRYAANFYRANGSVQVAVKGATETVLTLCANMLTPKGIVPLDANAIEAQALHLAESGYRVLAIADGQLEHDANISTPVAENDIPPLTLLGLTGFIDPLRAEVKDAVARCKHAGIRVGMITGDHPATAFAIARDLGIADSQANVVTGSELSEIGSPDVPEFFEKVKTARVFARVAPLQKLHIVESLIKSGNFVAVTGDGVNDAPALRKANIGVAMGSGTDVAKDTASIILTDDNFASIEAGVQEGRFAYDNIRKVTYLLISTGAAEVLLFTLSVLAGLPLPLFAVQLLWLNLVTNGIQDVALAFEGGEPDAMNRPPRKPTEGIFNKLMIEQTAISGVTMGLVSFAVWYWLLASGWDEFLARNAVLLLMVLFQNFHVFNCRSEYVSAFRVPLRRNPVLIFGVMAALGLQLVVMHIPFMQDLLRVAPVSLPEFLALAIIASSVFIVTEIFKILRRDARLGKYL